MNTNGANAGQLYLYIGIGILVIILIIIPIISMRAMSERKEPPKKVEPVPPPDETRRPLETRKPLETKKRDPKPEEKKKDETRVVKSFVSHEETSKGDSEITKSKTPAEAEFMLIMAWDPPVGNVRTCGWCGAEMDRSAARCPVCGRRG